MSVEVVSTTSSAPGPSGPSGPAMTVSLPGWRRLEVWMTRASSVRACPRTSPRISSVRTARPLARLRTATAETCSPGVRLT